MIPRRLFCTLKCPGTSVAHLSSLHQELSSGTPTDLNGVCLKLVRIMRDGVPSSSSEDLGRVLAQVTRANRFDASSREARDLSSACQKYLTTYCYDLAPVTLVGMLCSLSRMGFRETQDSARLLRKVVQRLENRLSGLRVYAVCALISALGRTEYSDRTFLISCREQYMRTLSTADAGDIAVAISGFHKAGLANAEVLLSSAERIKSIGSSDISVDNIGVLMNVFAWGHVKDPDLWHVLCKALLEVERESLQVKHVSLTYNALAKCNVRLPRVMQILGHDVLLRSPETLAAMEPRNVANCVNAMAKLEMYDYRILSHLAQRTVEEDCLQSMSFQELCNTAHGFAKLKHGTSEFFEKLFVAAQPKLALFQKTGADTQGIGQLLDTIRRRAPKLGDLCPAYWATAAGPLLRALEDKLAEHLPECDNICLTQSASCLVVLEGRPVRHSLVLDCLQMLRGRDAQLSPTNRTHLKWLIQVYSTKHESEFASLPRALRQWCLLQLEKPSPRRSHGAGLRQGKSRATEAAVKERVAAMPPPPPPPPRRTGDLDALFKDL